MAGYICIGALAAFGGLCALWALFGWLLSAGRGGVLVYSGVSEAGAMAFARRFLWLRDWGLLQCALVVVDSGLSEAGRKQLMWKGIELCGPADLSARLGIGAETN